MGKNTDEFFIKKREWSKVKDQILECYLKPYFSKIKITKKGIVYIDGFAGKGKFDDGSDGSPLIAHSIGEEILLNSDIKYIFIENQYSQELINNVNKFGDCEVINGNYEDNIEKIIDSSYGKNVFLYIDPFGIRNIKYHYLKKMNTSGLHSAEFLMNLNSFGFIREGCRLMRLILENIDNDYEKSIDYQEETTKNTIENMNSFAGGDYWQSIITRLKNKSINGFQAEKEFSNIYCDMVKKECKFKYVINIPIRTKCGTPPKYRLVFGTNNIDAIILMNDNMCNRFEEIKNIQNCGCITLFMENSENEIISKDVIRNNLYELISENYVDYYDLFISYINKHGITKTSIINSCLKELELEQMISIKREPASTQKGKKSKFILPEKGKMSFIKKIEV